MGISAGCCVKTACCYAACSLCSKCGAPRRVFARLAYVIFALIWAIFSIVMLFYGDYVFSIFNKFLDCPYDETEESCIQISAVYRTSFTLVIFHLILFCICLLKGPLPSAINEGAWPLKILLSIGLYVLTFFISNSFFKIYGYVAMVLSGIFIIYEMILLIDLAYTWNGHWVSSYDNSNEAGSSCNIWIVLLFTFTFIFYGLGIVICVYMYMEYYEGWWTILLTSITIGAAILYTIISLLPVIENGSIFTCSLIFLFSSCLNASAVMSDPTLEGKTNSLIQISIGLVFLFVILFYISGTTSDNKDKIQKSANEKTKAPTPISGAGNIAMEKSEEALEAPARSYNTIEQKEEEELPQNTTATALFHLVMVFVAFYFAMLLTNWGAPNIDDDIKNYTGFSKEWLGIILGYY